MRIVMLILDLLLCWPPNWILFLGIQASGQAPLDGSRRAVQNAAGTIDQHSVMLFMFAMMVWWMDQCLGFDGEDVDLV